MGDRFFRKNRNPLKNREYLFFFPPEYLFAVVIQVNMRKKEKKI